MSGETDNQLGEQVVSKWCCNSRQRSVAIRPARCRATGARNQTPDPPRPGCRPDQTKSIPAVPAKAGRHARTDGGARAAGMG